MFRYRKNELYAKSAPKISCPFCDLRLRTVIKQLTHAAVIKSDYPYDLWEYRTVTDHLLVIPKRHVTSMADLDEAELLDIIKLIAEYENEEYNVYSRSRNSIQKTVTGHQHTHLLKTDNDSARFAVFVRRPHWLFRG